MFLISLAIGSQHIWIRAGSTVATPPRSACPAISPAVALRWRSASWRPSIATDRPILFRYRKQSAIVLATPKTFTGTPSTRWVSTPSFEQAISETHQPYRRAVGLRGPIFLPDGNPYLPRQLIGKFVECQCGDEANHALRNTFCGLRETVVSVERCVSELVKPSREPKHLAIPFHAAHGGGCNARIAQLCQALEFRAQSGGRRAIWRWEVGSVTI